jgi:polysaccharide chain length determinant protein (PEP-CTERM system associated)
MDIFANGFNLALFLDMLRRRIWIAITLFCVAMTAGASFLLFLPNFYTARAFIRVEVQEIPTEFVRPTVTIGAERRFQSISKDLLSKPRLEKLIQDLKLYPNLQLKGTPLEEIAKVMQQDILIRRAAAIEKYKDSVVFEVNYTNHDPEKAMLVANTLAANYVEENTKVRKRLSFGTTDFLQQQLEETKQRLEDREQKIMLYKRQHVGELPEEREANFRSLEMLQRQMETISENLARVRDRQNILTRIASNNSVVHSVDRNLTPKEESDESVSSLKNQLAELKIRLSDRHPDVVQLKNRIATREAKEQQIQNNVTKSDPLPLVPPDSPIQVEQVEAAAQIQRLLADLHKVNQDIALYKQRVQNTGKREQELNSLTRDYDTTRDLYRSLLKRYEEASMANDMEQEQRSESFSLVERATYPQEPSAPKRFLLFLCSLALSLALAVGGSILKEMRDSSFHQVDDLKKSVQIPLLIEIPQIVTNRDRFSLFLYRGLGVVVLTAVLFLVVNVSYFIANGNEQLVRMLVGVRQVN